MRPARPPQLGLFGVSLTRDAIESNGLVSTFVSDARANNDVLDDFGPFDAASGGDVGLAAETVEETVEGAWITGAGGSGGGGSGVASALLVHSGDLPDPPKDAVEAESNIA